ENLSTELFDYLTELGYPRSRIDFILSMDKVNTTKRSRPEYFTPQHQEQIRHSERFLFQLFPEYLR
ncbi:MAG: hypothetical protein KDB84_08765, partial [Flavobacteriales bacterium]|nr:hypothetical protein [Flavobacteriales bacterium]